MNDEMDEYHYLGCSCTKDARVCPSCKKIIAHFYQVVGAPK